MKAILTRAFLIIFCLGLSLSSISQDDPPPPPPANHGSNGNQQGRGAPLGGGTLILLSLGIIYGIKRTYIKQKENKHQPENKK